LFADWLYATSVILVLATPELAIALLMVAVERVTGISAKMNLSEKGGHFIVRSAD
jgi:heme/copper-type cytochrome/quinol oxidase subunit 1